MLQVLSRLLPRFMPTSPVAKPDVRLIGEHITLRPIRRDDAHALFRLAADPLVTRFLPWEAFERLEEVYPLIDDKLLRNQRGTAVAFAILDNTNSTMVGSTELAGVHEIAGQGELGYLLDRSCWGKGYMTEAANLTLRFAFQKLHLNRVIAYADEENYASHRVLEKVGMVRGISQTRLVKRETRIYLRYELARKDFTEAMS